MEKYTRAFYSSPRPGDGHSDDWVAKPYSIVSTVIGLFILILEIAIFLGYRQIETTRHNTLSTDKAIANLLTYLLLRNHPEFYANRREVFTHGFHGAVSKIDLAYLKDIIGNREVMLDAGKILGDERIIVHEEAGHGV